MASQEVYQLIAVLNAADALERISAPEEEQMFALQAVFQATHALSSTENGKPQSQPQTDPKP